MLLLHTTNRNYQKHVAYQFVPFQMTLNDLGDYSPVAGFFSNAIRLLFMRHFAQFQLTHCVVRSIGDSLAIGLLVH